MSNVQLYNQDCMEAMAKMKDKEFELAIVDPPYRDENENQPTKDMRNNCNRFVKGQFLGGKPTQDYFHELFRVSVNQIIWGANNFSLPNYKGFVVWKKITISEVFTMSMAELAYLSEGLSTVSKIFEYAPQGTYRDPRIHPTQKPVALYKWLLKNYAKPGDRILDTHLGSGSSAIAADIMGFDFVGYEIDKDYYEAALDRFNRHKQQTVLEFA